MLLAITGIAEAGSLARYARHVPGISSSQGALRARWRAETPAVSGDGLTLPAAGGGINDETVAFAAGLTGRSGKAPVIEAALARRTGRPRPLPVRAGTAAPRQPARLPPRRLTGNKQPSPPRYLQPARSAAPQASMQRPQQAHRNYRPGPTVISASVRAWRHTETA